jgi:tungstate transport system permease protein
VDWSIYTEALRSGIALLITGAAETWVIIETSLKVSGVACLIAVGVGVPVGVLIGSRRFRGRRVTLLASNTGMGLPPVVVGLVVAMAFSRRGPFGDLGLLYTKQAMVVAQLFLALPLVVAFTAASVAAVPHEVRLQARSLGAGWLQEMTLVVREARMGVVAAIAAGFGAIISEVGAVQMVGGNIAGDTRVMTTAIVQYTRMGRYGQSLALALILIGLIIIVNAGLVVGQTSAERHGRGRG